MQKTRSHTCWQTGMASIFILLGILVIWIVAAGAWYFKVINVPNLPPPGCEYQEVQCIQAPCSPILVCDTNSPSPQPSNPSSVSVSPEAPKWETYQNEKYGFQIDYPSSWQYREFDTSKDKETEFWLFIKDGSLDNVDTLYYPWKDLYYIDKGIQIVVPRNHVVSDLNFSGNNCNLKNESCTFRFNRKPITFQGVLASQSTAQFPSDKEVYGGLGMKQDQVRPYTFLIFNYKDKQFVISYDHSDFLGNRNALYDKILASFKFLDNNPQSYTCPANGWEGCMPVLTEERKKECTKEALDWKMKNCLNFKGATH